MNNETSTLTPAPAAAPKPAGPKPVVTIEAPSVLKDRQGLVLNELDPAQRQQALSLQPFDLRDHLKIVEWGADEMKNTASSNKRLIDTAKALDVASVGKLAMEARDKLRGLGKVKKGWFQSLSSAIQAYIEKGDSLGKVADAIYAAQGAKEQEMRTAYSQTLVVQNQAVNSVSSLRIKIAAGEAALDRGYELAMQKAQEYAGTTDPMKIQELQLMQVGLVVANLHVAGLKTAQADATMQIGDTGIQLQNLMGIIGSLRNARTVGKQLWEHQFSKALINAKSEEGLQVVTASRETLEALMQANADDLGNITQRLHQELGKGVVSVEVLEAVAAKQIALQDSIATGLQDVQLKLQQNGERATKLTEQVAASQRDSAKIVNALKAGKPVAELTFEALPAAALPAPAAAAPAN